MSSWVEHRDGRIAFDVCGRGPDVLFVQGVGVHGGGWKPQVDALSSRFRCVTFDHRGLGGSAPTPAAPSLLSMAEDARAVLDQVGARSAHVAGHSLGGLIALELALSARDRVDSLALLCTFASGRAAAPLAPAMVWRGLRSRVGPRSWRRRAFLELILPPSGPRGFAALSRRERDARAAELAPLFGHDLGDLPPVARAQLAAMRRHDVTARLAELTGLATLVVSATHDPIAPPRLGRAIADGIPGARFVEVDDASHGLTIDRAGEVNRLLLDHLRAATPSSR